MPLLAVLPAWHMPGTNVLNCCPPWPINASRRDPWKGPSLPLRCARPAHLLPGPGRLHGRQQLRQQPPLARHKQRLQHVQAADVVCDRGGERHHVGSTRRHLPECQLAPREGSIGSVLGGGKQGEASGRALTVLALHHSSAATHDPSLLQPACLQAWAPAAPVCRDTPPLAGGVPPPPGVTAGDRSCAAASRARTAGVCIAAVSSLATFWNSTRLSPSAVMPAGGRGGRASGRRHAWHRRGAQCRVATPRRAGNC